jgi:DNA-binding transcriptional LysR family regulator
MTVTLRQLAIFEKVALYGSVTKAGEGLLISQSGVSMALAELERLSGGELFARSGRRLYLNERGRLLLPEVQEILQRATRLEQALQESADDPAGILLVGASTTIGNYLLPVLFGRFARRYRRAKVVLQVGNTQQISAELLAGRLDIGLIEGPCHTKGLICDPWRDDELVVIAPPGHPWSKRGRATPAMLAAAPWIMRERGSGTREVFEGAMARLGSAYQIALELGHTEAIKKAVEGGLGVSCLSRLAVGRELEQGWLKEIHTPLNLGRELLLLTRQERRQTPLYLAFLALLKDPDGFAKGGRT